MIPSRTGRWIVVSLVACVAAAITADAFAHGKRGGSGARGWSGKPHRHFHGGARVFLHAAPVFYVPRYYYPAPVYYAPPPAPTVYIEQPQAGYWHYCPSANAYYPQVQACPEGWQLVSPQPRTD